MSKTDKNNIYGITHIGLAFSHGGSNSNKNQAHHHS